jgi:hypothetical protein
MRTPNRYEWWDGSEGVRVIAEKVNRAWKYFKKEDVRWFEVPEEPTLRVRRVQEARKARSASTRSRCQWRSRKRIGRMN